MLFPVALVPKFVLTFLAVPITVIIGMLSFIITTHKPMLVQISSVTVYPFSETRSRLSILSFVLFVQVAFQIAMIAIIPGPLVYTVTPIMVIERVA